MRTKYSRGFAKPPASSRSSYADLVPKMKWLNVSRVPYATSISPQVFHGTNYIGGLVALKKHLLTQGPRERKAVAESNRIKGLKRRASEYAAIKDIEKLCGEDAEKKATRYGQIRDAAYLRAAKAAAIEENAKAELVAATILPH